MDRGQPAQGGRALGRQARVRLAAQHVDPGLQRFTRYFYAQQDKDGAIIDERYNHGGLVADYIVNELDRKPMGYFAMRDGKTWTSPAAGIFGPKVMIINESAGSGGDALPYYFKHAQDRPARRHAHVGRARRHDRRPADDRRRRHHGAELSVL